MQSLISRFVFHTRGNPASRPISFIPPRDSRNASLHHVVSIPSKCLYPIHTVRQTRQDGPVCVVRGSVKWVSRQSGKFLSVTLELSGIRSTPPKRTRHRQDSFVVSGAWRCEYIGWRNSDVISFHIYANWFPPPSCGKNSYKCLLLWCHLNTLCRQVDDHMDIFLNWLVKFCLSNMVNLHQLTQHCIMPSYTHKMAIVSWP